MGGRTAEFSAAGAADRAGEELCGGFSKSKQ